MNAPPINVKPITVLKRNPSEQPQPLPLSPQGAEVVLGGSSDPSQVVISVAPSATTMFGPRGLCLVSETGPLWVADTEHHRLLGWRQRPLTDRQPADWVIGQPDFNHEGQNAKGLLGRATVSVPTGICVCGKGIAVADAWNHRLLIWHQTQDSFCWSYGIQAMGNQVAIADSGNNRVLLCSLMQPH